MNLNIEFYETIKEQYDEHQLALRGLQKFPIREDSSMRLCNLIFLNKIENFTIELKKLNFDIDVFNNIRNKMNNAVEKFIIEQQRADLKDIIEKDLEMFIKESETLQGYRKMLKEEAVDLLAENNFLYQLYKSKFIKRNFKKLKIRPCKQYKEIEIKKIKEQVLSQFEDSINKIKEKYKKYGIIK